MSKEDITAQIKTLEILNEELKFKHPKGSIIFFDFINEETELSNCIWYDNVGIGFPLKNLIWNPPEYQKLTKDEVIEVCMTFDRAIIGCLGCKNYMEIIHPKLLQKDEL